MKQDLPTNKPIYKDLDDLEKFFQERVGLGTSFDMGNRKLVILKKRVHMYYVNGLCDSLFIIEIIKELVNLNEYEKPSKHLFEIIENRLVHESVEVVKTIDEMVDQVLSGLIAVVVEGEQKAFIIDVRSYPGRQPEEPDTEKVVRGSRDGYVENIIVNTALTRRRIRDERLKI